MTNRNNQMPPIQDYNSEYSANEGEYRPAPGGGYGPGSGHGPDGNHYGHEEDHFDSHYYTYNEYY